jgi:4-carboxymuconolactone decarboxylase
MSVDENMKRFEEIYGANARKILERIGSLSPRLVEHGVNFVMGELYADDSLDLKTRELCIISSLASQGGLQSELRVHMEIALRLGVSQREIIAVIETVGGYAGLPRALGALSLAGEVFSAWEVTQKESQGR